MARAPVLGNLGLNPFGGSGVDFGVFDLGGSNRESNLILTRIEIQWKNAEVDDETYLAALEAYANTLDANSSTRLDAEQRVKEMRYRVEREVLVKNVDEGTRSVEDLLAYDRAKLAGLNQSSEEYRQRLSVMQSTQNRLFQDNEDDVVERYQDGQMTTAQLNAWYGGQRGAFGDNPELVDAIDKRIGDLEDRLVEEADAHTLSNYQDGKMAPEAFLSYAVAARSRYAAGTTDYDNWTQRIEQARDGQAEGSLMYRYDLSQKYAQLQQFIASNSGGSTGANKGSTSTSKRTVLGADGKWHTVTTTKHTAGAGPSPAEQAAYRNRQIEVADAKRQLAEIARKVATVGGFVSTATVTKYYQKQIGRFAKGSAEWYAVQGKLDSLSDRAHAESVMKKEGLKISYPSASSGGGGGGGGSTAKVTATGKGGGKPAAGGAGPSTDDDNDTKNVDIDDFMAALAKAESGGRYNATNKSSGAYGKYQIMPANWPGWAQKYLGDASAPQTPANQEKVAKGKMMTLYKAYGDWRAVAHWWLTGGSKEAQLNPKGWSSSSRKYVDSIMASMGLPPTSQSSLERKGGDTSTQRPGTGTKPKPTKAQIDLAKPLRIVTGVHTATVYDIHTGSTTSSQLQTKGVNFPTGLDGEAFKKFYAQYEQAYKSGADEFSVVTPQGETHYWIGVDPTERRDRMLELDQMRVDLFKERMKSYSGTPSEITAANQFDGAVEDAAEHELIALDTGSIIGPISGADPRLDTTTLATGVRLIDQAKAAIQSHLELAQAAFDRGDVNAAYAQLQMAGSIRASQASVIATYAATTQGKIAAIEKAYGVKAQELKGLGTFEADLQRLMSFDGELETELTKQDELVGDLRKIILKDGSDNPIFDSTGPSGQLMLDPKYHWEISGSGKVEAKLAPATGFTNEGGKGRQIEGMVPVDYRNGNTTIKAYTKYSVGTVGFMVTADGKRVAISGKVVSYVDATGQEQMFVENPFKPNSWSATPITYRAPAGFEGVMGVNGQATFKFNGDGGYTYSMMLDPKTGRYTMFRSKPPSFMSTGVEDEELGDAGMDFAGDIFNKAGFQRDTSGLTDEAKAFSDLAAPALGFSVSEYKTWKSKVPTIFGVTDGTSKVNPYTGFVERRIPAKTITTQSALDNRLPIEDRPVRTDPTYIRDRWYEDQRKANELAPRDPLPRSPLVNASTGFTTPRPTVEAPPVRGTTKAVKPVAKTPIKAPVNPVKPSAAPVRGTTKAVKPGLTPIKKLPVKQTGQRAVAV